MTGAFLRVKRDGKWQNLEVEHLTDGEREELLKDDLHLMKWLHVVCRNLAGMEKIFRELEEDGILQCA
jgi:hypothetical protein